MAEGKQCVREKVFRGVLPRCVGGRDVKAVVAQTAAEHIAQTVASTVAKTAELQKRRAWKLRWQLRWRHRCCLERQTLQAVRERVHLGPTDRQRKQWLYAWVCLRRRCLWQTFWSHW